MAHVRKDTLAKTVPMMEASAPVLEASTTASRANSLGKTDPHRMGRADEARRKLAADYADSTIAEVVTAR